MCLQEHLKTCLHIQSVYFSSVLSCDAWLSHRCDCIDLCHPLCCLTTLSDCVQGLSVQQETGVGGVSAAGCSVSRHKSKAAGSEVDDGGEVKPAGLQRTPVGSAAGLAFSCVHHKQRMFFQCPPALPFLAPKMFTLSIQSNLASLRWWWPAGIICSTSLINCQQIRIWSYWTASSCERVREPGLWFCTLRNFKNEV